MQAWRRTIWPAISDRQRDAPSPLRRWAACCSKQRKPICCAGSSACLYSRACTVRETRSEEIGMKSVRLIAAASCAAVVILVAAAAAPSQQSAVPDYITGVVQSSKGPEAGVWVIAETSDL